MCRSYSWNYFIEGRIYTFLQISNFFFNNARWLYHIGKLSSLRHGSHQLTTRYLALDFFFLILPPPRYKEYSFIIIYGQMMSKTVFLPIPKCVAFSSVIQSCLTLCDPMDRSRPGFPVHRQLPEFTQTHVHWVGDANHLILCRPHLFLPSIFPSIRVFSSESVLHNKLPKLQHQSFQWICRTDFL